MADTLHDELHRRTLDLIEPGEIELAGAIVHTDRESDAETRMHQDTIEIGELIAAAASCEDTYVYSGTDDPEFASNQHQGLTIDGEDFVWECQQLLRDGTFDIVFYYEAHAHEDAIAAIEDAGYDVVGVTV
jgi:orotate phosphoribosyltransferase